MLPQAPFSYIQQPKPIDLALPPRPPRPGFQYFASKFFVIKILEAHSPNHPFVFKILPQLLGEGV
jgi:hypothetical protein